jgi:MSHA biogenesis protein MshP
MCHEDNMSFEKRSTVAWMKRSGIQEKLPGLRRAPSGLRTQRGISIMIVVFLLAGVSVMALSMMNLSGTQHINSLYTVRGAQAYFAARSGMEYAIARTKAGGACANQNISGFAVTITCVLAGNFNEGGAAYAIYRLTTTASGGTFQLPDVTNREITATIKVP